MAALEVEIVGSEALVKRFKQRAAQIRPRLLKMMLLQMAQVAEYVRTTKLSGQVLKNRTGTLRRSILPKAKYEGGELVGKVGTNVSYAKPHEFGGTFRVPAHSRMQTQAFGRPIAPVRVNVSAHTVRFPERAFLRPSLKEKRDEVMAALRGEITAALKE